MPQPSDQAHQNRLHYAPRLQPSLDPRPHILRSNRPTLPHESHLSIESEIRPGHINAEGPPHQPLFPRRHNLPPKLLGKAP